jgi:hypothetical protein
MKQPHEQTFQKDIERCEAAILHQRVKKLNTHMLVYFVGLRSCEKRIREPSRNAGAEF